MVKPARTFRTRALRNIGSAGVSAARSSASLIGKAAAGAAKWATTDHTGLSDALGRMPKMGFFDTLRYTLLLVLASIASYAVGAIMIYLFFAYGIPFLFTVSFNP